MLPVSNNPNVTGPTYLTCNDGTPYGSCSFTKPYFCQNGVLINYTGDCGCPEGQVVQGTGCATATPTTCSDGTAYGACSFTKPYFCQNGVLINNTGNCGCPEGQIVQGTGCAPPKLNNQRASYNFTFYENTEPFLTMFCDKINPYDLPVREAAANAIRKDPGPYSNAQLFDIYDWVKNNIIYQNVPLAGIPYVPSDTLATASGDCKNQAVLIASMIQSIGGTAKVVADPSCVHAYTIVYFGTKDKLSTFTDSVTSHYGSAASVNYFTLNDGIWVIFDPAGGNYPGDTLPQCSGNRNVYFITSCLDCVNNFPDKQYTYNNLCYSQCPYGTISSSNKYVCDACPTGYQSCNNQCLQCPSGKYLAGDCLCYSN